MQARQRRRSKTNWMGSRALLTVFPSAAAPSVLQSCSAELLPEEDDDGLSHTNAIVVLSPMAMSTSDSSAYSDPESEAEQLLTSGDGNPHESRSSKQRSPSSSSSSRRLQKPSLIRREKLLERLEILAMEKSDDGDRDGLLRRSASTRSRTGACSASSLQGRQRG
jgi:hypothetical protein